MQKLDFRTVENYPPAYTGLQLSDDFSTGIGPSRLALEYPIGTTGITEPNMCDGAMEYQCKALQKYLMPADYVDPHEIFTRGDCENVHFENFRNGGNIGYVGGIQLDF